MQISFLRCFWILLSLLFVKVYGQSISAEWTENRLQINTGHESGISVFTDFSCDLQASLVHEKYKSRYGAWRFKRYPLAQYHGGLKDSLIPEPSSGIRMGSLKGTANSAAKFTVSITEDDFHFLRLKIDFPDISLNEIRLTIHIPGNPSIFGGGEQFSHYRLNGHKVPFFVEEQGIGRGDQPITFFADLAAGSGGNAFTTYYPIPVIILSDGWIFKIENKEPAEIDLTGKGKISFLARGNYLELTIGKRKDFSAAVNAGNLSAKTNPVLTPSASGTIFGLQGGFNKVLPILSDALNAGNPVSAIWIQDWCGKRVTRFGSQLWWKWQPDTLLYPNLKATSDSLWSNGVAIWGYINPYFADEGELFEEFKRKGYFIKNVKGEPYRQEMPGFPFYTVDLTHPEARDRMKKIIRENMIENGLRGWMADFGEWLPLDCVLHDGTPARIFHNRFPEEWAKLNQEAIKNAGKEEEISFFCRSGYNESARYAPMFWMGDQMVNFGRHDGLPSVFTAILSSAVSGIPINHSDIGGYTSNTFPIVRSVRMKNILLKWMYLNAFTPIFRTHEGLVADKNLQVYDSPELVNQFAQAGKIHALLAPYFLELTENFKQTGEPILRPLNYSFPSETQFHTKHPKAFMIGDRYLVFPDLRKRNSARTLYLPDGIWHNAFYGPAEKKIKVSAGIHFFLSDSYFRSEEGKEKMKEFQQQELKLKSR